LNAELHRKAVEVVDGNRTGFAGPDRELVFGKRAGRRQRDARRCPGHRGVRAVRDWFAHDADLCVLAAAAGELTEAQEAQAEPIAEIVRGGRRALAVAEHAAEEIQARMRAVGQQAVTAQADVGENRVDGLGFEIRVDDLGGEKDRLVVNIARLVRDGLNIRANVHARHGADIDGRTRR
jgi:hypothetical protein